MIIRGGHNRIDAQFDGLDIQVTGCDQRAISQFFISLNWDADVESLGDRKGLYSLVSLSDANDEYAKIGKQELKDLPSAGISALQDDQSASLYCRLMLRVVVGFLRHGSRGDCPEIGAFSPSLSRTLTNLQGYLAREEVVQNTMMSSIHAILNLKSFSDVRHFTASLTYWCRLVVFVEISKQERDEECLAELSLLKFTREGYNAPLNALMQTMRLAIIILRDNPTLPRIVWE
ncbi:unnamed protein product [Umbelopsis vinacea]